MYTLKQRMCLVTILCLFGIWNYVESHEENVKAIKELESRVEQIKQDNSNVHDMIRLLQGSLLDKIKDAAGDAESEVEEEENRVRDTESDTKQRRLKKRIENIENNIKTIENYLSDERETDAFLKSLEGETGKSFLNDMAEVKKMAAEMKQSMSTVFGDLSKDLQAVENFANSRNVIIGGVAYYDGIGSACGSQYDVCRVTNSDCRDGICQCLAGLSYDHLQQTCVDQCETGYGNTYQTVNNYIIRGHNSLSVNETELVQCKKLCESADTFICRSFDYFPRWRSCFLSEEIKPNVDNGWEYNEAGIHFQRDCKIKD